MLSRSAAPRGLSHRGRLLLSSTLLVAALFGNASVASAAGPGQPIFMGAPGLISGAMAADARVPVYVSWLPPASVGSGIASYEFERAIRRCITYKPLARFPASTSAATFMLSTTNPGNDCLRMRAVDTTGNVGAWVYAVVGNLRLYQQARTTTTRGDDTRILYDGSWTDERLKGASGGAVRWSDDSSAEATLEFVGTSIAFVTDKMPDHGSFFLEFDTNPVDANPGSIPIDPFTTNSATAQLRSIIWSRNNLGSGLHFLTVRPAGTGRIDLDAFVVIR